ncbi:MAG: N-acetylneuraminate synthase family protein [Spirochaetaceae bacterium]|nr:N-acetylneuraminate synthase family protein [Spirochaetaceae bacterium]
MERCTVTPFIIAELGTAHGGDFVRAQELVDAACESGADCVKFQIVYADEILHPNTGSVPLPGGKTPLYDVFKKLEQSADFFARIQAYAEEKNCVFLATPFGLKSAAVLKALNPALVKIASPELNFTQLLREVALWRKPVLLSAGVSRLGDIEAALAVLGAGGGDVSLLHCVTAYPAPPHEYNLRLLVTLRRIFGVASGVSDHSLDPLLVPSVAAAIGASAIEKHFCLSRSGGGLDDPIALPPDAFTAMVKGVREAAALAAHGGEDAALGELGGRFGVERVAAVLGDGVKRLAPAEADNYGRTNRSIHAARAIAAGEVLDAGNMAILRTEKILRPGLAPAFFECLLGRVCRVPIPSGEGIRLEDV